VHAQRADAPEHAAQRAVLAGGVGALQDDEQLEALVGIKQVLQLIEFHGECFHQCFVVRFVAAGKRLGAGVEVSQRPGVAPLFAAEVFPSASVLGGCHWASAFAKAFRPALPAEASGKKGVSARGEGIWVSCGVQAMPFIVHGMLRKE
jgi:hypothetical protein